MPPSKSLMASAKASIVSISKWLVGSSRSNMWGVCHANLWSKKLKFNMRKEQKRLIRVLVTLLVDLEQVVGILYRYLMPDYFFQKLPYSAKKLGPVELTWALKSLSTYHAKTTLHFWPSESCFIGAVCCLPVKPYRPITFLISSRSFISGNSFIM